VSDREEGTPPAPERGPLGGLRATLPADPLGANALPGGGVLREGGEVTVRATCPLGVCDGSGWIMGPEETARPCDCRKRRIEKARVTGLRGTLPKRYRGVSFDRPPVSDMAQSAATRSVVAEVRGFCEAIEDNLDSGRGLWLTGDTGTGKTTLAMLVSKAALEAGRSVAIYSTPDLLARIRRTFDSAGGEDSYSQFFQRLVSVDLLHLDDLGAERRTDWVLEQLYAVIDRRYNDERSVVFTTNLAEEPLKEQLGTRIVSRLVQMCDGNPLPLFGPDKREEYDPSLVGQKPSQPS
jgi:DNA replication protein DnaC